MNPTVYPWDSLQLEPTLSRTVEWTGFLALDANIIYNRNIKKFVACQW